MIDRRTRAAAALWLVVLGGAACRRTPPSPPAPQAPVPAANGPYVWRLPPGIPEPVVPADNPMSEAKVELGRRLFYDTRLSFNQTYACASCHQQPRAFTDGRASNVLCHTASFGWPSRQFSSGNRKSM